MAENTSMKFGIRKFKFRQTFHFLNDSNCEGQLKFEKTRVSGSIIWKFDNTTENIFGNKFFGENETNIS